MDSRILHLFTFSPLPFTSLILLMRGESREPSAVESWCSLDGQGEN